MSNRRKTNRKRKAANAPIDKADDAHATQTADHKRPSNDNDAQTQSEADESKQTTFVM
jgi:hypothetical protein